MVMQDTVTLLSERESKEGFTFLKIASLHKASGPYGVYYEMDAEFIPPIIHGEHHPFFLLLYRRILSAIAFKKDHLLERRRLFGGDLSIFCQHDPAHFLLLATLQEALSEGNYLVESPEVSPEQFYRVLRNLFSHLKNFSENFMECPAYQHQQLSETFLSLEKGILFLMENALPHNTLSITLKEQGQGRFQSEEIDDVLLTGHELYLAVFIQASDVGWISRVVEHIKIAAPSILDRLIFSALPGLPFSHVQKPPLRLPIKAGYEYFRLDKSHKYYEHIQAEKKIALFVSEEFNHAKLDIIGLQEEAS
jgi:type VI secretion system protein ImpJ